MATSAKQACSFFANPGIEADGTHGFHYKAGTEALFNRALAAGDVLVVAVLDVVNGLGGASVGKTGITSDGSDWILDHSFSWTDATVGASYALKFFHKVWSGGDPSNYEIYFDVSNPPGVMDLSWGQSMIFMWAAWDAGGSVSYEGSTDHGSFTGSAGSTYVLTYPDGISNSTYLESADGTYHSEWVAGEWTLGSDGLKILFDILFQNNLNPGRNDVEDNFQGGNGDGTHEDFDSWNAAMWDILGSSAPVRFRGHIRVSRG